MNARPNAKELRAKAAELKAAKTTPLTVENVDRLDAVQVNAKVPIEPKPDKKEKKQKPPKDPKDIKPPQAPDPNSKRSQRKAFGKAGGQRLPHGSRFEVTYDAEAVQWSGTFTVPGYGQFGGRAGGVFGLLSKLDIFFRNAKTEKKEEKPPENSVDVQG